MQRQLRGKIKKVAKIGKMNKRSSFAGFVGPSRIGNQDMEKLLVKVDRV